MLLTTHKKDIKECYMSKVLHHCRNCGDEIETQRWALGYKHCLVCGDILAKERKFTVAPINKSNYYFISDTSMLKQLNPKRTT
jgi:hypothetical protein